ncbi:MULTISPECIES: hypothetical protein [unclassified Nocardioides]|uniref:hypothetical protein n=1 Tax=unclassified Nocardioides TaxID=2615069 RepID=UPI0006FAE26A|nr:MULTISPECIES: hypothetical protein [unclassified Nocardioides]KRA32336.1 hypothetical protein ASD81_12185 [Nocardioides sp. Root614]KRA88988.1 hypothetical protein ASD84_12450 [Nocardioides sp. Root682]
MALPDRDVLLCRDCCCGTTKKHPAIDHSAQRDAIEALDDPAGRRGPRIRVRVVDCLDECDRSNVVLVRDFTYFPGGRRPKDTWLGGVLSEATTDEVVDWVREGGAVPPSLAPRVFRGRRQ